MFFISLGDLTCEFQTSGILRCIDLSLFVYFDVFMHVVLNAVLLDYKVQKAVCCNGLEDNTTQKQPIGFAVTSSHLLA